jgi:hypothetical protein
MFTSILTFNHLLADSQTLANALALSLSLAVASIMGFLLFLRWDRMDHDYIIYVRNRHEKGASLHGLAAMVKAGSSKNVFKGRTSVKVSGQKQQLSREPSRGSVRGSDVGYQIDKDSSIRDYLDSYQDPPLTWSKPWTKSKLGSRPYSA